MNGDVTFSPEADGNALCSLIEHLYAGTVTISKPQEAAFRALTDVKYEELVVKDEAIRHRINDQAKLFLDLETLKNYPQGVEISDVAHLTIDPEIPNEMIYERLRIDDVAYIKCSTTQAGAIGAVSHDVATVRGVPANEVLRRPQDGGLVGGLMKGLFGTPDWGDQEEEDMQDGSSDAEPAQDTGIRLINADRYIL